MKPIYIGTAAWNIPKNFSHHFDSSHNPVLKRYAGILNAVEINSSFYKDHQAKTYSRWAETVPEDFKFSVKLSKQFTHVQKLEVSFAEIHDNLASIKHLGSKLGVLLIQLPPKQVFNIELVSRFLDIVRSNYEGQIAIEPRHETWSDKKAFRALKDFKISKVCADPERCPVEDNACGWSRLKYYRLHGSPDIYKSDYDLQKLKQIAQEIKQCPGETWCIFDNTTFGHATDNAVALKKLIAEY